jgi:hypothetical protein
LILCSGHNCLLHIVVEHGLELLKKTSRES